MHFICKFCITIFLFIPYIIPWYASDFALMSMFGSYRHFPEGGFPISGMLMALPVTVGTAPWGVSRTFAYCAVSPTFGRCRVPGTRSRGPSSLNSPRPFRHLKLIRLQKRKYAGCEVWWGCNKPFEMVGSCPHIAVVMVLVCPHFPSLRYCVPVSRN